MIENLRKQVDARVGDGSMPEEYTTRGEEGTLHRVEGGDGQAYWVKRWNRSHEKNISAPYSSGRPFLSPYWHEQVRLEGEIVHSLFPSVTPEMVGSYDERLEWTQTEKGPFRNFKSHGTPVTITKEAVADEELLARLNAVVKPAYDSILSRRDRLQESEGGLLRDDFVENWRLDVDRMVKAILGDDVSFDSRQSPSERIADLTERSPGNVMIDMLQAGIVPIHPELNFVPGSQADFPRVPHGTFIENRLYDGSRVRAAVMDRFQGDPVKERELMGKIDEYELRRVLDQSFDKVILDYSVVSQWRVSPGVGTMVFVLMDELRKKVGVGLSKREDVIDSMEAIMIAAVRSDKDPQRIVEKMYRDVKQFLGH